jgi:MFS family permease
VNGLGFSNLTQLTADAGFLGLFFFLTLYMQEVLGYSPIKAGLAYLPLCGVIAVSASVSSQLLSRVGTRPVIVAGAVIAAGGLSWLSHLSVRPSYVSGVLPGMLVLSAGLGPVFVGTTTAANAGVPASRGRKRSRAASTCRCCSAAPSSPPPPSWPCGPPTPKARTPQQARRPDQGPSPLP